MSASVAVTEMFPVAVEPYGNQAEQIREENEEEERQAERDVAVAVRPTFGRMTSFRM